MSKVFIKNANYDDIASVVEEVFSVFPLDVLRKKVLVKPNILGPFPSSGAVTTHPGLVESVVKKLMAMGANVVVGDNAGIRGYGMNERSAKVSGIYDASLGSYENISKETVRVASSSGFVKEFVVSKRVLDADLFISLPKLKTHNLTLLTGAVKNSYGILPGAEKTVLHKIAGTKRNFAEMLLDVFTVRVPDLVIMDAVVAMEGNGPTSGFPKRVGKILASDNAVELDAVACAMVGMRPQDIEFLKEAKSRGLGEIDISKIEIDGNFEKIKDFRMPSTFMGNRGLWAILNRLSILASAVPKVIEEKCVKCGICAKHCPVEAISMDDLPVINRRKCISCYCCHEMCPEGALEIRSFFQKISRKNSRD
ncbi:MAG TPA: DUF362 domain-containing protein [Actinobacteria bacterium]|nr:DUF362 domain-containing protein [Actinomycetota bacterium]